MDFFKRLFAGKKKPESSKVPSSSPQTKPTQSNQPQPPVPIDPALNKDLIRVFDGYGRECFITRQQWRDSVLLGNIKKDWNNPDKLYELIYSGLVDGFRSDVVQAAEHLYQIDPNPIRGTCVWGIVLMEEGRLDEAERVFRGTLAKHGEDGVILTNLAKVQSKRKLDAQAEQTLWHALEVDPNQDNGLLWYQAIYRERGGESAAEEAFKRVARLPGSWRAQLWLARAALSSHHRDEALVYYRESMGRAPKPVPNDLLMQISGDLGKQGYLFELLELVEPHFDANRHGIEVGNNLIKAHFDLRQLDAAHALVEKLYAMKCPAWKQTLSYWETEISKARATNIPAPQPESLKMNIVTMDGPVWLPDSSPVSSLFSLNKSKDALVISFLAGTVDKSNASQEMQFQMADTVGRVSRMLPLFLAEQVHFLTQAKVQSLIPLIHGESAAFVVSGTSWSREDAANYARQTEPAADYAVTIHIFTQAEPWKVELRLIRTIDGTIVGSLNSTILVNKMEESVPKLTRLVVALIAEHTGSAAQIPPTVYQVPEGANLPYYLLRLEQLLAIRCRSMDGVKPEFLTGERDIIDGNIQLCLACPANITTRALLAQTLLYMKRLRPQVIPEFAAKLSLLQREKPLNGPAHNLLNAIFNDMC